MNLLNRGIVTNESTQYVPSKMKQWSSLFPDVSFFVFYCINTGVDS